MCEGRSKPARLRAAATSSSRPSEVKLASSAAKNCAVLAAWAVRRGARMGRAASFLLLKCLQRTLGAGVAHPHDAVPRAADIVAAPRRPLTSAVAGASGRCRPPAAATGCNAALRSSGELELLQAQGARAIGVGTAAPWPSAGERAWRASICTSFENMRVRVAAASRAREPAMLQASEHGAHNRAKPRSSSASKNSSVSKASMVMLQ